MITILDRLKTAGLDQFIPADLRRDNAGDFYDPYTEDAEELEDMPYPVHDSDCDMSQRSRLRAEFDSEENEENRYLDTVKFVAYEDDDEEERIEGRYPAEHEIPEGHPETLYDLKEIFHLELLPDEDFLKLKVSDLFRVTDNELKFLDGELIPSMSLDVYIKMMEDPHIMERFPAPEKRIRYCQIKSVYNTVGWGLKLAPARAADKYDLYRLAEADGNPDFNDDMKQLSREQLAEDSDVNRFIEKIILNQPPQRALSLLDTYGDYLMMYPYAAYRNLEHMRAEEPVTEYPLSSKVSHLKDLHDKAMRDYNVVDSEIYAVDSEETDKRIRMQTETPEYKQFLYRDDDYCVIAPDSVKDMRREGDVLNHCVASYVSSVACGSTKIYFVRKNSDADTPFYTVEVKQQEGDTVWSLTQCYTTNDSTDKDPATRKFIKDWCRAKNIKIRCYV